LTSRVACGVDQSELAIAAHGQQMPAGGIERHARALRRARIGEMHADARSQLVDIDRLGQIIDPARLKRPDDMLGLGQAPS
jgi:hypothetical protein